MARRPRKIPEGCSECRSLTPEEIAELETKLSPPLTKEEIQAKRDKNAISPDMSHLTPWAP